MGKNEKKSTGNAVLKIKYINERMNLEKELFEDIISSDNSAICLDFPNGVSLMEDSYKSIAKTSEKLYIEFYDEFNIRDMFNYLVNDNSNYRVITGEGVVVRLSKEDLELVEEKKYTRKKEYNEDNRFIKEIKKLVHKKDE